METSLQLLNKARLYDPHQNFPRITISKPKHFTATHLTHLCQRTLDQLYQQLCPPSNITPTKAPASETSSSPTEAKSSVSLQGQRESDRQAKKRINKRIKSESPSPNHPLPLISKSDSIPNIASGWHHPPNQPHLPHIVLLLEVDEAFSNVTLAQQGAGVKKGWDAVFRINSFHVGFGEDQKRVLGRMVDDMRADGEEVAFDEK